MDVIIYVATVNQKGAGRTRDLGYCPKILLLKRAKTVLCTRDWPVSETKFLMALSSPGPFVLLEISIPEGDLWETDFLPPLVLTRRGAAPAKNHW